MRRATGFTLLELMVVVTVIAVLAGFALPTFTEYLRKGKRAEAVSAIGDIQLREERYRADNPTYGTLAQVISPTTTTYYNNALKYFSISVSNNTASAYTITATRKGDLASDPKCANFVMDYSAGIATKKMSDNKNVDYCWRQK